jgi:hypothetical protein
VTAFQLGFPKREIDVLPIGGVRLQASPVRFRANPHERWFEDIDADFEQAAAGVEAAVLLAMVEREFVEFIAGAAGEQFSEVTVVLAQLCVADVVPIWLPGVIKEAALRDDQVL